MLLAIDSGNTNIVFAVFDGDDLRGEWRSSSDPRKTADEYGIWLTQLMALGGFTSDDISEAIAALELNPACERASVLVNRTRERKDRYLVALFVERSL